MKKFTLTLNPIGTIINMEDDPNVDTNIPSNKEDIRMQELQIKDLDFNELINRLKDALAEEFNAWYQYIIIIPYLKGPLRPDIAEKFKELAKDELEDHAYWLMERLNQLSVDPQELMDPSFWNETATHKYIHPACDVLSAINNNIEAEKGAIETYTSLEEFTRNKDIVTHTKIKEILSDEQEHLSELYDLKADIVNC